MLPKIISAQFNVWMLVSPINITFRCVIMFDMAKSEPRDVYFQTYSEEHPVIIIIHSVDQNKSMWLHRRINKMA